MTNFDNLKDQAMGALQDEGTSDSLIEKGGDAVDQATGGQYADKIDQAQSAADERLGSGDAQPPA